MACMVWYGFAWAFQGTIGTFVVDIRYLFFYDGPISACSFLPSSTLVVKYARIASARYYGWVASCY